MNQPTLTDFGFAEVPAAPRSLADAEAPTFTIAASMSANILTERE